MAQHPQKLSELLAQTTAARHREEHNIREAERLDAYREFSDDGDSRELVGVAMAERLLTPSDPVSVAWRNYDKRRANA